MRATVHCLKELYLKSLRIMKAYGIRHFLSRAWRFFKKHGWRSTIQSGNLNHQYQKWIALRQRKIDSLYRNINENAVRIGIIMPVYNPAIKQLKEAIQSVLNQKSPFWELCLVNDGSTESWVNSFLNDLTQKDSRISYISHSSNRGISEATNSALGIVKSEYVLLMDQDDVLLPHAVSSFQDVLNKEKGIDLLYADEDKLDELSGRRVDPFFKPGWSPHLLYSFNYIGHPLVLRKELITKIGGFRKQFDGSQDHDLILRLSSLGLNVRRIPDILYSWRISPGSTADGWDAKPQAAMAGCLAIKNSLMKKGYQVNINHDRETGVYNLRIKLKKNEKVSIIIPTKDNVKSLKQCLDSIHSKSSYDNYEIIVIDNGSNDNDTLSFLEHLKYQKNYKVLNYPDEFNYSLINNFAARYAEGEQLLFLNDDTQVITPDWIEALYEYSQMSEVGAVGPLLIFQNDLIQHAGIVVGMRGSASHAFYKVHSSNPGYFNLIRCVRNVSAVTGACMMLKKDLFNRIGGFNPIFRVGLNDVDLCLRLLNMGFYNVYTPHAKLYHYESLTRGDYVDSREIELFWTIYRDFLLAGDPYYHPELSLDRNDFSLAIQI